MNRKPFDIYLIWYSEGKWENVTVTIYEDILTEHNPKLKKDINPQIPEFHQSPGRIRKKKKNLGLDTI